jgi:hypothetical protein
MMMEMRGKVPAEAVDEEEVADGPVVAVMTIATLRAGFGTCRTVIPNQRRWYILRDGRHGLGGPREPRL